jgi:hypothetical protein
LGKSTAAVQERPAVRPPEDTDGLDWSLLSSHGKVVLFLALCPDSTIQHTARALDRTERAVARTVASLRRSGIVRAKTVHRRKLFSVNLDASLFHPTLSGYTLRQVFGNLRDYVRREGADVCEQGLPD